MLYVLHTLTVFTLSHQFVHFCRRRPSVFEKSRLVSNTVPTCAEDTVDSLRPPLHTVSHSNAIYQQRRLSVSRTICTVYAYIILTIDLKLYPAALYTLSRYTGRSPTTCPRGLIMHTSLSVFLAAAASTRRPTAFVPPLMIIAQCTAHQAISCFTNAAVASDPDPPAFDNKQTNTKTHRWHVMRHETFRRVVRSKDMCGNFISTEVFWHLCAAGAYPMRRISSNREDTAENCMDQRFVSMHINIYIYMYISHPGQNVVRSRNRPTLYAILSAVHATIGHILLRV